MKHLLTVICLIPVLVFAQNTGKYQIKKQALPAALVFLAGAADGFVETISHNYPNFKKAFPNANDRYFSPALSFTRKYKNGDRTQGERFLGSTGPLVFLTDAYHLGRFLDHLLMAGALSLKITQYEKKKWYIYVVELIGFWAANRIGFYTVYSRFK